MTPNKHTFKLVISLVLMCFSALAWSKNITIALVYDGQGAREMIPTEQLKKEIKELLEPQHKVSFVPFDGGWSEVGIQQVLQQSLSNPKLDMVITTGLVGTHIAGKTPVLNKPVIGTFAPEPRLQGLPITAENTSGKKNYVYISDLQRFDKSMNKIFALLPKKKVALVTDKIIADGVPMLANPEFYGESKVQLITTNGSLEQLVNSLPNDIGAVMLAPLPRLNQSDIEQLSKIFIERQLPSVSFASDIGVNEGILMAIGTDPAEAQRSARRVALNVLSVVEGERASALPVFMKFGRSFKFNAQTARAIGFELPWEASLTANTYGDHASTQNIENGMTLHKAIESALDENITLESQRLSLDIANDDLTLARANWWPQLTINAQAKQLDKIVTSSTQPEGNVNASVELNQLIYSEQVKSGLDIAKLNKQVSRYQLDAVILNTIQNTSVAYVSILRAKALEKVQKANLNASIKNLALSENRFSLGAVTESDVLRWKSQIATDKRNLLSAQTNVNNAIINLQNILQQPLDAKIVFNESDTQRLIDLSLSNTVKAIFNTPSERNLLKAFILEESLNNAPEIKQIDVANAISARSILSAKRAFYLPTISLNAQYNENIDRFGEFSHQADALLPDNSWSVSLNASYPLFQGAQRKANLSKANRQAQQNRLSLRQIKNNIRTNSLNQWNAISSSYPAIFLSRDASNAAKKTLSMVREQYSSGVINITTLIEAQNSALAAELAAAEAQYAYLIDFINLGRAMSDFSALTEQVNDDSWLNDFYQFKTQQLAQQSQPIKK